MRGFDRTCIGAIVLDTLVREGVGQPIIMLTGHGTVEMLTTPLQINGRPPPVRLPAPGLGEHTDEVLSALGLSIEEITALRAAGAI